MPEDTVEVPTLNKAKGGASGAKSPMIEGAMTSVGVKLGGRAVPVVGQAVGGFLASVAMSRERGKQYANQRAGEEAMTELLR